MTKRGEVVLGRVPPRGALTMGKILYRTTEEGGRPLYESEPTDCVTVRIHRVPDCPTRLVEISIKSGRLIVLPDEAREIASALLDCAAWKPKRGGAR